MATFDSFDGTEIWFDDQPGDDDSAPAVLLLHGFAADTNINFVRSGLLDTFLDHGYRVIAMDTRGHGLSGKPHEPEAYADRALVLDVRALLDHLGIESAAVVGYSMGGGIALEVGAVEPRITRIAAVGLGGLSLERGPGYQSGAIEALLADELEDIPDAHWRQLRRMADAIGADRFALAACMQREQVMHMSLGSVRAPVLVVAGEHDELAGPPGPFAALVPEARAVTVPGDHYGVTSQPELHDVLVAFLAEG